MFPLRKLNFQTIGVCFINGLPLMRAVYSTYPLNEKSHNRSFFYIHTIISHSIILKPLFYESEFFVCLFFFIYTKYEEQ